MADEIERDAAPVRRVAWLDQIKALPSAEHTAPIPDRDGQGGGGQHRLDVAWHVVWPFLLVGIVAALRREALQRIVQVDAGSRGRGLLDDERGSGGAAEQREES